MIELQEWLRQNWDDGEGRLRKYGQAGWGQVYFIRDHMSRFGKISVISEHRSKSVVLPVYHLDGGEWWMVARDNFYGWVVSVAMQPGHGVDLSSMPDHPFEGWGYMEQDTPAREEDWPVGMFAPYYAEGFPVSWCFGRYGGGAHQFTIRLSYTHDLYMLGALMATRGVAL